jgi:hypothetical protein
MHGDMIKLLAPVRCVGIWSRGNTWRRMDVDRVARTNVIELEAGTSGPCRDMILVRSCDMTDPGSENV